jgi:hypothetical protein
MERTRAGRTSIRVISAVIVLMGSSAWVNGVDAQAPPAASQAIPRMPDGKPDLSGVWQALNSAAWDVQDHHAQSFPGLPPRFAMPGGQGVVEGNEIPYQPAAAARKRENYQKRATADPEAQCFLPGVPRITYMGLPFQIVQTPRRVTMLYEFVHAFRNIPFDSKHPEGPLEFWLGDSRGRWDGDTLVVDVVHFTDQTWFDRAGNFHSEQLHVVERYTPVSRDHITYEVTIEDPKTFTRPWKMSMPLYRRQERNIQLLEFECYAFIHETR